MMSENLSFVTIEPRNNGFVAFLSVEDFLSMGDDPELAVEKAAEVYEHTVKTMRCLITKMQDYKAHRKPIPACIMWRLGDAIFQLKNRLEMLSLQLDGTYSHLVRDLGVKREWLEKPVIFRRYLPREDLIPESLSWARCRKEIRGMAERLREGLPLD